MGRVGLVLAGGGITGMAFHSGALAALEEVTDWDPRRADLIVGTSAGSIAGAILRLGVSTADQMARVTGAEPSAATKALFAHLPPPDPKSFPGLRPPTNLAPVDPAALARALRMRGRNRRMALIAAGLPEGAVDTSAMREGFGDLFGDYPEGLWITAVRVSDGRLAVFGRDTMDVSVPDAIAASSAIPGFFKAPEINGERYVDGGVRSMANADLLADERLDLVIVSSPMTFRPLVPGPVGLALAGPLRSRLRRELAKVRRSGTKVLVLEPDTALRQTMGANPMDPSRRPQVTLAARDAVRTALSARDLSDVLRHF